MHEFPAENGKNGVLAEYDSSNGSDKNSILGIKVYRHYLSSFVAKIPSVIKEQEINRTLWIKSVLGKLFISLYSAQESFSFYYPLVLMKCEKNPETMFQRVHNRACIHFEQESEKWEQPENWWRK